VEAARFAVADDVGVIVALTEELRAELTPMRGGAVWSQREARFAPDAAAFEALIGRDDVCVVAGTIEGAVVGFGVCVVEPLHDGEDLGVIDELYVTPDARGVGVGEQVLAAMVTWCRERGCVGIDALALPGHRAAKNFFEGAGLTARALVMHRSLRE